MLAIAAWIAKQERLRISERTKAGMARAQREGIHCGRPARVFNRAFALQLRKRGMSLRNIAAVLGVSLMTISRALSGVTKGAVLAERLRIANKGPERAVFAPRNRSVPVRTQER